MSLKFSGTRLGLAFAQKQALALGRPGVGGLVESESECICTVRGCLIRNLGRFSEKAR